MPILKLFAAAGALGLSAAPALAQGVARAAAAPQGHSELFGGSALLTIVLIVALGIGIFLLVDDEDDPDSP